MASTEILPITIEATTFVEANNRTKKPVLLESRVHPKIQIPNVIAKIIFVTAPQRASGILSNEEYELAVLVSQLKVLLRLQMLVPEWSPKFKS
jgi:hypothetical protein